jgi:hypothetical protein
MPVATLIQPSQLLHYLPTYRVLICKECRYAIQPSAISRHLKDIHRIYRGDRQAFIQYTLALDLAEPGDVIPPEPHDGPVPFLPTKKGFACTAAGCIHLCVTVKRMKSHWSTSHKDVVVGAAQWRPVDLQTFFLGNQLRYFLVTVSSTKIAQPEQTLELNSQKSKFRVDELLVSLSNEHTLAEEDVVLFDHFKTSTYLDLAHNEETEKLWGTIVPQLALKHPFITHGILACSALHLAHLNPSQKQEYHFIAARHQNEALPAFRVAITNPNESNCNALLAFSQLLIIHSFASEEQDEDLLLVGGSHESGSPDWMNVVRGSCVIFKDVMQYIESGPFKPLVIETRSVNRLSGEEGEPDSPELTERIRRLGLLLNIPFNPSDNSELANILRTFGSTLLKLSRAFRKADEANLVFTIWTAVYLWPAQLSQEYLDILRQRHPVALILLAHYCILLEPLESHWYMNGFRKRLMSRIYRQVDPEWWPWLKWPMEEVGLSVSTT